VLETHDFDNPWRKVYEWPMTATWLGASALSLAVTKTLPVPTRFGVATSLLCAGLGAYRATQAWKRSQDTTRVRLAEKQFIDIPAMIDLARQAHGRTSLWLGKGFQWTDIEASRMHALINGGLAAQLGKDALHKEGAYWLHGLAKEEDVELDLSMLEGHTLIVGATGVGKTRLVRDFIAKVGASGRADATAPRVYAGEARAGGASYEIFSRILRARFGIADTMSLDEASAHLRNQVAEVLEDRKVGDVIYFLGQLLGLSLPTSPLIQAVESDREELRSLRRAVLKRFFEADARGPQGGSVFPPAGGAPASRPPSRRARPPIVLVLDDLQWAHDDSVDLLAYLMSSLAAPILMLCIARPEIVARRDAWNKYGEERHQVVELGPLSENDAAAVMHDLLAPCGDGEAVDELVDAACTLAGGNPALLEQMVRIYHDMGVVEVLDPLAEEEKWKVHPEKLSGVRLPWYRLPAITARIAAIICDEVRVTPQDDVEAVSKPGSIRTTH